MAEQLEADLNLGFDDAISAVESALNDVFDRAAQNFSDATATAVTDAISSVAATPIDIPVAADTAEAFANVDDFSAYADSIDTTLGIGADDSTAQSVLDDFSALAESTDPHASLGLDTSEADAALDEFSARADDAGSAATVASAQTSSLGDSMKGLEGAALLATGQVGGMRTVVQGFGASAIPAVAGAVALGGGILSMAEKAVQGVSATQRFTTTLGQFAKQVEQIHVGTLNASLDKLSVEMGTVPSATKQAAATVFQFATSAGFGGKAAAQFTSEVVALAARAVALNPALGTIADVIPLMSRGLAVGGRFAQRFNLDLNAQDIIVRALADTHKGLASELTVTEKQMAGAEIASAKYGSVLGKDVANGAKNATLQQRSFRAEIEHSIEVIAKPLVAPFFQAIESGIPAIEALGKVLATLAVSAFPAIIAAVQIITPILTVLADVFQTLGPIITIAIDAFVGLKVVGIIGALLGVFADAALSAAIALPAIEAGALAAASGIEAMDVAIAANPIGLLAAGIALVVGALGVFGGASDAATVDIQKLGRASDDTMRKLAEGVAVYIALEDTIGQADAARQQALDGLTQALEQGIGTGTRFGQALVNAGVLTQTQFNKALADASRGQQQLAADTQISTTAVQSQATAYDAATAAGTAYQGELDRLAGRQGNAFAAQTSLAESTNALTQSLFASGPAFALGTDNGDKQRAALSAAADAAKTLAVDTVNLTGSQAAGQFVLGTFTDKVAGLLAQFGLAPAAIDALIGPQGLGLIAPAAGAAAAGMQQLPDSIPPALRSAEERMLTGGASLATTAAATGSTTGQALGSGFAPKAKAAIEGGVALSNAVLSSLARLILNGTAFNAGYGAGLSLDHGLAQGIRHDSDQVAAAAKAAVIAAVKAARNAGSPTEHLFYDAGRSQMAALAKGYADAGSAVVAEAEGIVRAASNLPGGSPLPLVAAGGAGQAGGDFNIQVDVHGVSDPALAEAAGRAVGRGIKAELDGSSRRRLAIAARSV